MTVTRWTIVIFAAAAVAAGSVWYVMRPEMVAVISPVRGDAAEIVYASGVVEPLRWAKITPIVRGRIVEQCNCEGDHVDEAATLARLDDSEAQAQLAELELRHKLAAEEYDRIAILVDRNAMTQQALDRAASEVAQLEASIAGQRARLENYVIRSPVAGRVLRQDADVGEVAELNTALFWVGEPRPLIVVAEVNEEDIPRVEPGQAAMLRSDAFAGQALDAEVAAITPKGDPLTKTYRVRFALPDDTPLLIGMSVDVNVVIRVSRDTLILPSIAMLDGRVFVVEAGIARQRAIETGISGAGGTEILSGLAEDDRVISPYPETLQDGARVDPRAG